MFDCSIDLDISGTDLTLRLASKMQGDFCVGVIVQREHKG